MIQRKGISCIYFLRKSVEQHKKLKVYLQNEFITGDGRYPNDRKGILMLLDKYNSYSVTQ